MSVSGNKTYPSYKDRFNNIARLYSELPFDRRFAFRMHIEECYCGETRGMPLTEGLLNTFEDALVLALQVPVALMDDREYWEIMEMQHAV